MYPRSNQLPMMTTHMMMMITPPTTITMVMGDDDEVVYALVPLLPKPPTVLKPQLKKILINSLDR